MAPPAALAIAAKAQAKAHAKDQDQLMDALRELLTSCGEYEVMHDDEDLFAHGSERPLVPRSASLPVEARDPRPPHSQRSHSIPHVAHVTRQATFAQPPVAAAPTHGPADAAPERTHERSRLFGHHAYLRSL
jgi:hypothetical protein